MPRGRTTLRMARRILRAMRAFWWETETIQSNPFYYGVPSLSFGGSNAITGLTNTSPSDTINQTISFSDFVSYSHKRHNMRFGLDIRRVHADSIGGAQNNLLGAAPSTPLGEFSFTGYATGNPAAKCTPSSTVSARCCRRADRDLQTFFWGCRSRRLYRRGCARRICGPMSWTGMRRMTGEHCRI